ncbi:MAG: tRNA (adenosine(37)-N6)-threonylcarbamoyltransferase complex dimerization subunit type 1 TsaB [Gammaproteobacteria bacterium]|nr:tRNA (adenosine(37)-N6)-threonylcarbamoyltransferase complex dimerization subunit type 1 TsaB [Gammaproteobacteria bacterium]MBL6999122.1 tRNA (adenosine(37)-N6)-threonylcarbamoyltransferase complex dimerization subunit type 1 TsaB [Gammaproteobacteria bacterium]
MKKLNILAIETSTEACSVAVLTHRGLLFSEFELTPRQHTQFLPRMMDAVLVQAGLFKKDLSHIAYASGPGAFTGVRIAASTAQGISIGLDIPLVAISTLAILAQHCYHIHHTERVMAALDARMGEAYVGNYQLNNTSGLLELDGEETLVRLNQLRLPEHYFLAGSGFMACREAGCLVAPENIVDADLLPHASALVQLAEHAIKQGKTLTADQIQINYIRNKVAEKKKVASL